MLIHFSHANGFPASSYKKFFSYLAPEHEVHYIDVIGHNSRYPVVENWPHQVRELIDYIEEHYSEPVIGMGHSFGGVLTYIAAQRRPELFKALVLFEPPIFNHVKATGIGLVKHTPLFRKITIGGDAAKRRRQWGNATEALDYFRSKRAFKYVATEVLEDYISAGTIPTETGITLRIAPELEQHIALTIPHRVRRAKKAAHLPFAVFYGANSHYLYNRFDHYTFELYYHAKLIKVPGSHIFPLEHPQAVATEVKKFLNSL